jgi:hypothetical protein
VREMPSISTSGARSVRRTASLAGALIRQSPLAI